MRNAVNSVRLCSTGPTCEAVRASGAMPIDIAWCLRTQLDKYANVRNADSKYVIRELEQAYKLSRNLNESFKFTYAAF